MTDAADLTSPSSAGLGQRIKDGIAPLVLDVLKTVLVAWFGLQITGKLDLAIKDRQVTLESAKSMAGLVETMQSKTAKIDEYRATALKLAMFGEEAIQPLIFMAAAPAPYNEEIPLDGLKLIAVLHKTKVCSALDGAVRVENAIDGARVEGIKKAREALKC